MIREVIVDRKVLDGYAKRALATPNEHMEVILGKVTERRVYIHAFGDVQHYANKNNILYNPEDVADAGEGTKLKVLGTIHSHPGANCIPSDEDVRSATDEIAYGICAWRKYRNRKYISFGFWAGKRPLELFVAEG